MARFPRLDQPRQDIGRAPTRRPLADARPPGHAGIGIGHVGGGAFVAGQDMGDAVIEPEQAVVERQAGVAAQAEDMSDAVRLQHPHHRIGPCR